MYIIIILSPCAYRRPRVSRNYSCRVCVNTSLFFEKLPFLSPSSLSPPSLLFSPSFFPPLLSPLSFSLFFSSPPTLSLPPSLPLSLLPSSSLFPFFLSFSLPSFHSLPPSSPSLSSFPSSLSFSSPPPSLPLLLQVPLLPLAAMDRSS